MGGASNTDSIISEKKMGLDETFSRTFGELPSREKYLMNLLKPKRSRKRRKKGKQHRKGKRKRQHQKNTSATKKKTKWETDEDGPQSKNKLDNFLFYH